MMMTLADTEHDLTNCHGSTSIEYGTNVNRERVQGVRQVSGDPGCPSGVRGSRVSIRCPGTPLFWPNFFSSSSPRGDAQFCDAVLLRNAMFRCNVAMRYCDVILRYNFAMLQCDVAMQFCDDAVLRCCDVAM